MIEVEKYGTYKVFKQGQSGCTVGKTITETDISFFRRLSGWPCSKTDNVDELLVTMVSIGLMNRLGFLEGNLVAVMENEWQFLNRVIIGDTIKVRYEVVEVTAGKKGDNAYRQGDELLAQGRSKIMTRK